MNPLKSKSNEKPNASRFDVFISYSRDDAAFVRRLYDSLNERQRRAWVDWKGIPPTADWMAEVFAAVESADNFVFVLSKASLASEICSRELEHAVKCRKRLVPFVWGELDETLVPTELRRLNWIICRSDQDFKTASASLLEALTLNLEWVREHTRLLVRAVDWRDGGGDASLLLRGMVQCGRQVDLRGRGISASGQVRQKAWSLDLTHLLQEGCAALRLYLANPAMIEQAKMCS